MKALCLLLLLGCLTGCGGRQVSSPTSDLPLAQWIGQRPAQVAVCGSYDDANPRVRVGFVRFDKDYRQPTGGQGFLLCSQVAPVSYASGSDAFDNRALFTAADQQVIVASTGGEELEVVSVDELFVLLFDETNTGLYPAGEDDPLGENSVFLEPLMGYGRLSQLLDPNAGIDKVRVNNPDGTQNDGDVYVFPALVTQVDGDYRLYHMTRNTTYALTEEVPERLKALAVTVSQAEVENGSRPLVDSGKVVIALVRVPDPETMALELVTYALLP